MKAGNITKVDNYGAVCLCCIRVCDECISVFVCIQSDMLPYCTPHNKLI